jgi:hypothetical protein
MQEPEQKQYSPNKILIVKAFLRFNPIETKGRARHSIYLRPGKAEGLTS